MTASDSPIVLSVSLQSSADGTVHAQFKLVDEINRLSVAPAKLTLTLWRESPNLYRCSCQDAGSGTVAYAQAAGVLNPLLNAIELAVVAPHRND